MKNWYTVVDGKIDRIKETSDDKSLGPEWMEAPNDWNGHHDDKLEWFDKSMRRIPDPELIKQGKRKDNMGLVYNIHDRSTREIYNLDEELTEDETKESPLENEPYQKFDKQRKKWIVDTERKETIEKESSIAKIDAEIEEIEKKKLRSAMMIMEGTASDEDRKYNKKYNAQLVQLRSKKEKLKTSA